MLDQNTGRLPVVLREHAVVMVTAPFLAHLIAAS